MTALPHLALAKLAALEMSALDSEALAAAAAAPVATLSKRLHEIDADDPSRSQLEQALAQAEATQRVRRDRYAIAQQTVIQINMYLSKLPPNTILESYDPAEPEQPGGESIADAVVRLRADGGSLADVVARVRGDLQRLQSELMHVRSASLPKSALKALARERVTQMAKPPIIVSDRGQFSIHWQTSAASFAAWFSPDALIAALEREIDAGADDGLTSEARKHREREIADSILEIERQEESLIELSNGEVARRVVANPLAILGIRVAKPPANLSLVA